MFGFFQNNTPPYAGEGQPRPNNSSGGSFGFLGGLFTSATPSYATASKDAAPPREAIVVTAQTESAPSEQLPAQPDCRVPLPCAIVIQRSEQCK